MIKMWIGWRRSEPGLLLLSIERQIDRDIAVVLINGYIAAGHLPAQPHGVPSFVDTIDILLVIPIDRSVMPYAKLLAEGLETLHRTVQQVVMPEETLDRYMARLAVGYGRAGSGAITWR